MLGTHHWNQRPTLKLVSVSPLSFHPQRKLVSDFAQPHRLLGLLNSLSSIYHCRAFRDPVDIVVSHPTLSDDPKATP